MIDIKVHEFIVLPPYQFQLCCTLFFFSFKFSLIIQRRDKDEDCSWSANGVAKATREAHGAGKLLL